MIGTVPWDEYHENAKYDKVFKNVANLINNLSSTGYQFIGFTNRPEKFRALTVGWLVRNKVDINEVLMRPDDCYLKAKEMKLELVKKRFNNQYGLIHFIIDDDEESILEFYKLGIPTLHIRNIQPKDLF